MLSVNFSPFPKLQTERLVLRRLTNADVDTIFKLRSDPQTMKFVARPLATTLDEAFGHISAIDEKINSNTGINWAISLKGDLRMIGIIGIFRIEFENSRAEIGYMLLPEHHGKGLVSEAIAAAVKYGFEKMRLHSIEAVIDPANLASGRALEKNGFVREAHLRENICFEGKFLDTVIYSILESDYREKLQ